MFQHNARIYCFMHTSKLLSLQCLPYCAYLQANIRGTVIHLIPSHFKLAHGSMEDWIEEKTIHGLNWRFIRAGTMSAFRRFLRSFCSHLRQFSVKTRQRLPYLGG